MLEIARLQLLEFDLHSDQVGFAPIDFSLERPEAQTIVRQRADEQRVRHDITLALSEPSGSHCQRQPSSAVRATIRRLKDMQTPHTGAGEENGCDADFVANCRARRLDENRKSVDRHVAGRLRVLLVVCLVGGASWNTACSSSPGEAGQAPSRTPSPAVTLQGPQSSSFGRDLSHSGDFNNDGVMDIAVGAHGVDKVFLYSAGSDQPYLTVDGPAASFFGASVDTAGDFNGDGVTDLLVGAPEFKGALLDAARGKVFVYAGPTARTVLFELAGEAQGDYFGHKVVGGFDFNRDGKGDILVIANQARPHGKIYVYAGGTGRLLFSAGGVESYPLKKFAIDRARDLNGDGFDEVIVGSAPDGDRGHAWIYRGPHGALHCEIAGVANGDYFAEGVAGGGDFNGDGRPDVAIGARGADGSGRAYVYNGHDCALIATISPPAGDVNFGRAVEFVGDVNGDGSDELAVCSSVNGAFRVHVIGGRRGAVLYTYDYRARTSFGARMAGQLDFTLDGIPDIAVGAAGAASVLVYSNNYR